MLRCGGSSGKLCWWLTLDVVIEAMAGDAVGMQSHRELGAHVVGEGPRIGGRVGPASNPAADAVFAHFHDPEGRWLIVNERP